MEYNIVSVEKAARDLRTQSTHDNHSRPHVLIVGAGITGLLLAQSLKKAGISYGIFDSETLNVSRPREWSLALHWSIPILQKLLPQHLFDRLSEAQADPAHDRGDRETIELRNSDTGEILKTISTPGMKRVSRKKFRNLCKEGIEVLWAKDLSGVQYPSDGGGVIVSFADGTSYHGDLLVGTDGPKSKMRELLLGKETARNSSLGVIYNMSILNYRDVEKAMHVRSAHPVNCLGYNPGGTFSFISISDIPDPKRPETWVFQVGCSWLGERDTTLSSGERLAAMKKVSENLAEPFYSAVMWIPDDTTLHTDSMSYWVPVPWDNHTGRVTLCGDAAHPLPPYRGQGMNHCILDASNLMDSILKIQADPKCQGMSIATYEDELISRGQEEVEVSVKTAMTIHNWDQFMNSPLMKHGVTKMADVKT